MAIQVFDDGIFDPDYFDCFGQSGWNAVAMRRRRKRGTSDYGGGPRLQGPIVRTSFKLPVEE